MSFKNMRVELDGNGTRVIDGRLLKSEALIGREVEAIALYNRIMGIITTTKKHTVVETDEPFSVADVVEKSDLPIRQRQEQINVLADAAGVLGEKIADAVVASLKPIIARASGMSEDSLKNLVTSTIQETVLDDTNEPAEPLPEPTEPVEEEAPTETKRLKRPRVRIEPKE